MRIAIFSECYTPYLNGVVTSIEALREGLDGEHRTFVFAPGARQPGDGDSVFRLPQLPFPRHPYRYARPFPVMPVDFASLEIDVVHSQHPFTVGRLAAHLARKHSLPLVYTVHAQYDLLAAYFRIRPLGGVASSLARRVFVRYAREADAVVVPSQSTAGTLRGVDLKSKPWVIPSAVPTSSAMSDSRDRIRREIGICEAPLLLYVGRLCPVKNLDVLMRAFAMLQTPNAHLALVGDGPERGRLHRLACSLGISARVVFVGQQSPDVVASWYRAADVFALPCPFETQGLVLAEAMGAGLPCVVADTGGAAESVRACSVGLCVSPTPADFAHALDRLLSLSDESARMRSKAIDASERFRPAEMASRMLEVYECVRSRNGGKLAVR